MTSKEIRNQFKDFFASKQHQIVSSAPMVIKDDPTLMFKTGYDTGTSHVVRRARGARPTTGRSGVSPLHWDNGRLAR